MTRDEIEDAAARLHTAETSRKQIRLLSQQFPGGTMDEAYAIQAALVERKLRAGAKSYGWKIGLTSKAMQQALNIDIPDSGILLDDMVFADGGTVPAGRFIQPRVEAEIAFITRVALADPDITVDGVLDATEWVCPALEILDTRVIRQDRTTGKIRTFFDTIADNAANAGIVLGPQRSRPREVDLRWVGAILTRNGEVEETGLGAGVLNHPAEGIVWLVRRLAQYGMRIEAGSVVLSGSFVRPVEARPGDKIVGDFGRFGRVEIDFG